MKKRIIPIMLLVLSLLLSLPVVGQAARGGSNFIFVLDSSGSMLGEAAEALMTSVKSSVNELLAKNPDNKIALVIFDKYTRTIPFMSDANALCLALDREYYPDGTTDIGAAIRETIGLVEGNKQGGDSRPTHVIIFSDGLPNKGEMQVQGRYNDGTNGVLDFTANGTYDFDIVYCCNAVYEVTIKELHPIVESVDVIYYELEGLEDGENLPRTLMYDLIKGEAQLYTPGNVAELQQAFDDLDYEKSEGNMLMPLVIGGSVLGLAGIIGTIIGVASRRGTASAASAVAARAAGAAARGESFVPMGRSANSGPKKLPPPPIFPPIVVDERPSAALVGLSGMYKGARFELKDEDQFAIGRDPHYCNIVITSDKEKVSREHCSVCYRADKNVFEVVDLSTNGTYVGKRRLKYGEASILTVGDSIRLADSSNCFGFEL